MTTLAQTVNFHNQTLTTLEKDGKQYVAMKPICENIGLDWVSQHKRIQRKEALNSVMLLIFLYKASLDMPISFEINVIDMPDLSIASLSNFVSVIPCPPYTK